MLPDQEIGGCERYWRRCKPGSNTSVHEASDVRIFINWVNEKTSKVISINKIDEFIE